MESRKVTFIETPYQNIQAMENVAGDDEYLKDCDRFFPRFKPDLTDGSSKPAVAAANIDSDSKKSASSSSGQSSSKSDPASYSTDGSTTPLSRDLEAQTKSARQVREVNELEVSMHSAL